MTSSFKKFTIDTPNTDAIYRTALLIFWAAVGSNALFTYLAIQNGAWQLWGLVIAMAVFTVALVISMVTVRRGRAQLSAWLILGGMLVLYPIFASLISGLGLPSTIVGIFLTIAIANQILPRGQVRLAVVLAIASNLFAFFIDSSKLSPSFAVPILNTYIPIISIILIFIFGYIFIRQFPNYSLSTKLIITFLGTTLLSVGLVSYITTVNIRTQLTEDLGKELKAVTVSQAQSVDDLLSKQLEVLQAFALNKLVQDEAEAINNTYTGSSATIQAEIKNLDAQWRTADSNNNNADPLVASRLNNIVATELIEFQETFPEHIEIFITDKYGANIATTNRTSDYYQADEEWWQAAYNGGEGALYIGQPAFDESAQSNAVIIAVPLFAHGTKEIVGILRSTYSLDELTEVLTRFGSRGGAEILLPNNLVYRDEGNIDTLDEITVASIKENALVDYSQFIYEDELSLVSQAPVISDDPEEKVAIDNLQWVVILNEDPKILLAPVDTATNTSILTGLGSLLIVTILAILIARSLSTPISQLTTVAQQIASGNLNVQAKVVSQDEIGQLATSFNTMTSQLVRRATDLATVAEVGTASASLLEVNTLLKTVVELTKERFNLYHSHVYLLDASGENLILASGAGEAGKQMLEKGLSIPLDQEQSLVARAARERKGVRVNDVTQTPDFLPNPLLPNTRSELAVPLIVGDKVLGVFDVQSDQVGRFTESDIDIQTTLASQVAIAIQNANQYQQTQKLQAQYTLAVEGSNDGIWDWDVATNQVFYSPRWKEMIGYNEDELNNGFADFEALLHPEDHDKTLAHVNDYLTGRISTYDIEFRFRHKNGSYRWIRARGKALRDSNGAPYRMAGSHTDITETREAQKNISRRAEELVTVAQVSSAASTILDSDRLLQEVVNLTKERFNLYHSHIYLLNESADALVLASGAGEAGKQMVAEKLTIPLNREQSLVARAAREKEGVIVNDVRAEPDFLPNLLLPNTRSELAVPLIVGDKVLGVFDVQSDQVDRFTAEDVNIQTTLASQIAIALQNARAFSTAKRQAERETALNTISQKIQSATTVEAVLQIAARELGQALGAPMTIAQLAINPQDNSGRES